MSETELYGLMAVAQEHQKAAERHQKAAQAATQQLQQVTANAPETLREAAREALTGASSDLQDSVRQSQNAIQRTAMEARAAMRAVSWSLVTGAFAAGLLVGSVGWGWFVWHKLDVMQQFNAAIYQEVHQPEQP